jgi:hypothetical protein
MGNSKSSRRIISPRESNLQRPQLINRRRYFADARPAYRFYSAALPVFRLARSTFDLFGIVKRIVDAKAQFRSLAEPWADTGTSTRRLMLAVLGGLADVERDLIRTRTAEGRSRAKAQGRQMGRPLPSRRSNRKRPPDAARTALRCKIGAQLQGRDFDHPPRHARGLTRKGRVPAP